MLVTMTTVGGACIPLGRHSIQGQAMWADDGRVLRHFPLAGLCNSDGDITRTSHALLGRKSMICSKVRRSGRIYQFVGEEPFAGAVVLMEWIMR